MKKVRKEDSLINAITAFVVIGIVAGIICCVIALVVIGASSLIGMPTGWMIPLGIAFAIAFAIAALSGWMSALDIEPDRQDVLDALAGKRLVSKEQIKQLILEDYGKQGTRWEVRGTTLSKTLNSLVAEGELEIRYKEEGEELLTLYRLA